MSKKKYCSLGFMSGTSMDGVDASLIISDGYNDIEFLDNIYSKFPEGLYLGLIELRSKIQNYEDINENIDKINKIERELTLFHAEIVQKLKRDRKIDLIGFHGQTIFHNPEKKISKQIGNGNLLAQLTKNKVVYDFRKNDLENGGQGAPLTPIFHNLISKKILHTQENKNQIIVFLNIGGISNLSIIRPDKNFNLDELEGYDIGPGNCLIDNWVRNNSKLQFDKNGEIASSSNINQIILNQAIDNIEIDIKQSLDISDFDISFARGLSFEEGCATISELTGYLISKGIEKSIKSFHDKQVICVVCGGGRKNNFLINSIKKNIQLSQDIIIKKIDEFNMDGDFIESQAFGYLAIRSYLNLPFSFPKTTRCKKPVSGGIVVEN